MHGRPPSSVVSDWPAPPGVADSTLGGSQLDFGADVFGANKSSTRLSKPAPKDFSASLPAGSQYDFGADVFDVSGANDGESEQSGSSLSTRPSTC